jgi:hypothetical protein
MLSKPTRKSSADAAKVLVITAKRPFPGYEQIVPGWLWGGEMNTNMIRRQRRLHHDDEAPSHSDIRIVNSSPQKWALPTIRQMLKIRQSLSRRS